MATQLSRRKIAAYAAEQLLAGSADIIPQLASYVYQTRRTRELSFLVRDIEMALAQRGTVIATATSARALDSRLRAAIEAYVAGTYQNATVHVREQQDPWLLGGVRIDTPGAELDASVRGALNKLQTIKL